MLCVDSVITTLTAQPAALSGRLAPGQVGVILGRNGAGKSWLLKTMAGLNPVRSGSARWNDQPLDLTLQSARARAYLAQEESRLYPTTVAQQVMSGRHPWLAWHAAPTEQDYDIVQVAMQCLGVAELQDKSVQSLSGGEWQRVRLATLKAQSVPLWLLDEPAEHLDPGHIWDTLPGMIADHCRTGGAVVLVAHDPDWAAQIADDVIILDSQHWSWDRGEVQMTEAKLSALYGHRFYERDGRWFAG